MTSACRSDVNRGLHLCPYPCLFFSYICIFMYKFVYRCVSERCERRERCERCERCERGESAREREREGERERQRERERERERDGERVSAVSP